MDTTARDLFEKLKGQFKNLTLGKEDGTRTLIPGETSFFEFALQTTSWMTQTLNPKITGMVSLED